MRRPPLSALVLGLLLAAMGGAQLVDRDGFAGALAGYRALGGLEEAAALAVPAAELAAAAGLLAGRRVGGVLGLAVAVFWSVLAAQAFARGLTLANCGCFGVYLAQELRWWVLLQDAYLLALAWYAAAAVGLGLPLPRLRAITTA